ncbi:MAG: caspase family protein [Lepagella sp.]
MFPAIGGRRALVIGLGEQQDRSWSKINGDKDVALVVTMLKSTGFSDIVTLKNAQATKAGIVNAFTSLIRRSGRGDVVYIHFSGHGQLMTDLDGDESDGLDESWIPYDAYMVYGPKDRGEKHLSDDEVGRYLTELRRKVGREGVIAVVVDACHSGDSSRALTAGEDTVVVRGVDVDFKIPGKKSGKRSVIKEEWLTLSACQDYQLNQEYQGVGRLTHILTGNWQSYVGDSDKTILQKIDRTYESRKYKSKFQQNPDLTGETGKVLSTIFSRK